MMNFGSKAELYRDTKNVSARRPRVRVFLFSLAFFVDDWGFDWVALVVCGFILATHLNDLMLARVALSYYADPRRHGSMLTFTSTAVIARILSKMRRSTPRRRRRSSSRVVVVNLLIIMALHSYLLLKVNAYSTSKDSLGY